MGMDYTYSGSASYPRFKEEYTEVDKIFGGVEPPDSSYGKRFIFPEDINKVLVNWFNYIYDDLTVEETKIVWEYINTHPEIKDISYQIWNELELCVVLGDYWHIF